MATLNLSSNGPQISNSYNKIVNAPALSGAAASSSTYGQWVVYSVKAPLANAFTNDSGKESILNVQTTGEGELVDMIEEFSDGRIQFAFVKVKDPNTTLPKSVLIGWCGEGVPERTKGYFTSHLNAVSKLLHGYHVQVTARSDRDLTPELIVQKVADSSGSKYSGGGSAPSAANSAPPPPVASKPAMPTKSFGASGGFQPLGGRRGAPAQSGSTDADGWGEDAPQVTRSQLEKVQSAYQPTKVDINQLQSQKEPSRYQPPQQTSNGNADVVKGGYQPIGKVDINALRQQAKDRQDDRPTVVKGAYEPVGKVDIADIRRKAQGAPPPSQPTPPAQTSQGEDERPKSLADRSAAFQSSERMTSMPKPKVTNRFGSQTSSFAGTKAPAPGGFGGTPGAPAAAPVGTASKTFADEGGKTPAQIWAEKKARERGTSGAAETQRPQISGNQPASPVRSQPSGGWQSQYGGKKWGVQVPSRTGGSGVSAQRTGEEPPQQEEAPEEPTSGGVGSIRDRFKDAAPMGAPSEMSRGAPEPPALDTSSKPNAVSRGVPILGLPQRPKREEQEDVPREEYQDLPPPPPRPQPADEQEEEEEDIPQGGEGSPVRIAMPVARGPEPEPIEPMAESRSPPPMPTDSMNKVLSQQREPSPEPQYEADPARSAGQAAAATTFGQTEDRRSEGTSGGKTAIAQYDYEKAEENELELHEGEKITNIDMVDEDWWMGENSKGEKGLFPSNYVEITAEEESADVGAAAGRPVPPPMPEEESEAAPPAGPPQPAGGAEKGATATAQYDYEAAEDNELSFPDGAKVTGVVSPLSNTRRTILTLVVR